MTNGRRNHPSRDPWGRFAEWVKYMFLISLGAGLLLGAILTTVKWMFT